jgi:plastocyanin
MEKTWALTFATPGVYQYDCALHRPQGMKGTITVVGR